MFMPYFIDVVGKKHIFRDDFALKDSLVRAWRRGENVLDFRYRLKSVYANGHDYQIDSIKQTRDSFAISFFFESALGKEGYCI
jgi:hypothetical protein